MDSIRKSINGVSVVEGLGTERLVEHAVAVEGRAIVHIAIGLNNPDELLHGVIEVQLDLVARRSDRLVAGELELGDQIYFHKPLHQAQNQLVMAYYSLRNP